MTGAPPPIQPSRSGESRGAERSEPQKSKGREREFKLPGEREDKEEPTDDVVEAFEKEKQAMPSDMAALLQSPMNMSSEMAKDVAKAEGIFATEAAKAVDQIAKLIKQMVEAMRVGSVEGKQVTSIDLKSSNDFLSNANIMITQLGEGKIAVSFSNMSDANMARAINAVESNKAQLERLVAELQTKNITITEFRIGEQTVSLPVAKEAPPIAPMSTSQEGYRERGDERGGGGREQEGEGERGGNRRR